MAGLLGNTPAACMDCYIHPAILAAYRDGRMGRLSTGGDPGRRLVIFLKAARS